METGEIWVAIIDRESPSDRLGKVRKHSSWVPILPVILVAVLMVGAIAGLIGQRGNNGPPLPSEAPMRIPAGIAYATHSPISITSDAGFTTANGVSEGTGTASDPYVIANWDINASTANGIQIQGTTAYFIIRDCTLHGGGANYNGIYLSFCANGTLNKNDCSDNGMGIAAVFCTYTSLINNTCSNNGVGIVIHGSNLPTHQTISNNNCSNNGAFGMIIEEADGLIVCNNTCSSNQFALLAPPDVQPTGVGMRLYNTRDNIVFNNTLSENMRYGLWVGDRYPTDPIESSNSRIWNNTFHHNNGSGDSYDPLHIQAFDNGTSNWWNSIDGYGNYWSDWTTPDANSDGIVDLPYAIDGGAGAMDNYPLTTAPEPIPEFGVMPLVAIVLLMAIVLTIGARRRKTS